MALTADMTTVLNALSTHKCTYHYLQYTVKPGNIAVSVKYELEL